MQLYPESQLKAVHKATLATNLRRYVEPKTVLILMNKSEAVSDN